MGGFSPEWLALREPVDHRSRNAGLGRALAATMENRAEVHVTDLGCGTGSNLRATAPLLGARQHWVLVDYDAELLAAARLRLAAWAERASARHCGLSLLRDGREIDVEFVQADIRYGLEDALGARADLVTASAFFDLASPAYIHKLAQILARRRAAFYGVLTYNGEQAWTPKHPADALLLAAFHQHQRRDKGLGPAAGPRAAAELGSALRDAGYLVQEADSAWRLGKPDRKLITELATGYADAVRETGMVGEPEIANWRSARRTGAVVGHTDILALPFGG